jgi:hypothetical protein
VTSVLFGLLVTGVLLATDHLLRGGQHLVFCCRWHEFPRDGSPPAISIGLDRTCSLL